MTTLALSHSSSGRSCAQWLGIAREAYASYNLAFTRFALGQCDGVLSLLERSEDVQGKRREIDRLQREASKDCGEGGEGKKDKERD